MNRRLVGLSAVAVLLGGYLLSQNLGLLQQNEGDVPVAVPAQRQPGTVKLNPLQGLDPKSSAAVLERPLFNPGRRPRPPVPLPEPVVEQSVQEPPPPLAGPGPEDYKLLGVAIGPEGRIAALRVTASGEVVYVRKGEPIDSWSVVEVSDRTVAIGKVESPVTFRMFEVPQPAVGTGEAISVDPAQTEPLPKPLPPDNQ